MRLIGKFGLAAIVVAVAASFFVTSSAMAEEEFSELEKVVLCKVTNNPCPSSEFPSGTVFHAELVTGTNALFESFAGNIECTSSTILGTTSSRLIRGEITSVTFGGCTRETEACTFTAAHLNYSFKGELQSNHEKYELLIAENPGKLRPEISETCGNEFSCHYGATTMLLEALTEAKDTVLDTEQGLVALATDPLLPCREFSQELRAKYLFRCLESTTLRPCYFRME